MSQREVQRLLHRPSIPLRAREQVAALNGSQRGFGELTRYGSLPDQASLLHPLGQGYGGAVAARGEVDGGWG